MKRVISRRKFVLTGMMGVSGFALAGIPSLRTTSPGKVRVGLIGVGQRGLGLATLISKIPELELGACCDIVPNHLNAGMKLCAPKSKSYTDYQQLLSDKTIDAVVIATPLYLHYPMAVAAISANKHIYVEKTMTYDIAQAISLEQQMKNHPDLILQVGHQYRYYDMYPKIKKLIAENAIGTVTHFESQYNRNSNWRRPVTDPKMEKQINWRMYKEFSGGLLAELSAHQIDIVNWLTDSPPTKVIAMGDVNYWKDGRTTADNIRAVYEYPNGIKSGITSILSNEYNGYLIRILGSDGTLELGRTEATLYMEKKQKERTIVDGVTGATKEALLKGKGITVYKDTKGIEATTFALAAFANSIITKTKPASNVSTGKNTAIAVHMGNRAAETGTTQFWKPEYSKG